MLPCLWPDASCGVAVEQMDQKPFLGVAFSALTFCLCAWLSTLTSGRLARGVRRGSLKRFRFRRRFSRLDCGQDVVRNLAHPVNLAIPAFQSRNFLSSGSQHPFGGCFVGHGLCTLYQYISLGFVICEKPCLDFSHKARRQKAIVGAIRSTLNWREIVAWPDEVVAFGHNDP